jgi:tetratricopeptide (TPR) repeat protein
MIFSVTISDSREAEIADAIRSVVDHVDRVLLVDTGITDKTIERANDVAGDKLKIAKHSWQDFSTARNFSLDVAKRMGAKWAIIVDSDERIQFGTIDLRAELAQAQEDVLLIESDSGHYPKEKILRLASDVRYVGPTHEVPIGGTRRTLAGATFYELPKSQEQCRHKFARDVKLLAAYVQKHPDDPRWWYYLGSSYEGIGNRAKAALCFGECATRRRFGDEAAWAAYKQAEQFSMLKRYEECIQAAARGMGANSTFAECAWIAAFAAWELGRATQAVAWARIAEAVGEYKGCGTDRGWSFRHPPALYELPYDVLRFALPDEPGRRQADADFHMAKLTRIGAVGEVDLELLSIDSKAGKSRRDEARSMLRPPTLENLCRNVRAAPIELGFDLPSGWHPMNPSICRGPDGEIRCVVRTVNYTITGRNYEIHDPDGIVRTENYLGELVGNKFVNPRLMRDLDTSPRQPSQIVGYEDIRLVSIGGVLAGSATVCDRDPARRLIARLELTPEGDVASATVMTSQQQHEKNWMPIELDGKIAWIYSIAPTVVVPGPVRSCPFALEHLRGGAAIRLEDRSGYLCVVHETIETDERRIYLHRFVELSEDFHVVAVSASWTFSHYGIEFCPGLLKDGDDLILTYGLDDQEVWVMRVPIAEVEEMRWMES